MPSEKGEVIPSLETIALAEIDVSLAPATFFRFIWYMDQDYARRNRLGGVWVSHGHALEGYVSEELREKHPDWRGVHEGKPHPRRLRWSKPGVAEAIADHIIQMLDKRPETLTVSLSPDDGLAYDDSDDKALDAGDWDPANQKVSITDRQVWLCNRVVVRVLKKHPNKLFGMLAYGQSTRPPIREKPHPNLVPVIAPITYRRAHPITDDGEPNNKDLRYAVEGWGKVAARMGYYFYGWLLAEPSAPCPFITKWSVDLRFIYDKGNCKSWMPETTANFESAMHALYLGFRMAWDPTQDPKDILAELHEKFYGHAAKAASEYWRFIDSVWVDTPEYSGCGFGHSRRWTPEKMKKARQLLTQAKRACRADDERFRVGMADESLKLFELFMKLRRDLADGRWDRLAADAEQYRMRAAILGVKYEPQYAFGKMYWCTTDVTLYARYFRHFYQRTYDDAARVAATFDVLTRPPLREWRYQADKEKHGEKLSWTKPDFDDAAWKTTDPCVDTWSALGYHNYMGAMWYRTKVTLPKVPPGRKAFLWIGATDGSAKAFVNGKHAPHITPKGERKDEFAGYASPASFDITEAIQEGENQIAIYCVRTFLNELGTGGLLGPVVVYRERD